MGRVIVKWIVDWLRSGIWGLCALLAVNTAGAFTGVTLGYSWLCISAAGFFGVPGVITLVLLNML